MLYEITWKEAKMCPLFVAPSDDGSVITGPLTCGSVSTATTPEHAKTRSPFQWSGLGHAWAILRIFQDIVLRRPQILGLLGEQGLIRSMISSNI